MYTEIIMIIQNIDALLRILESVTEIKENKKMSCINFIIYLLV